MSPHLSSERLRRRFLLLINNVKILLNATSKIRLNANTMSPRSSHFVSESAFNACAVKEVSLMDRVKINLVKGRTVCLICIHHRCISELRCWYHCQLRFGEDYIRCISAQFSIKGKFGFGELQLIIGPPNVPYKYHYFVLL
jgi:hypothetical protein